MTADPPAGSAPTRIDLPVTDLPVEVVLRMQGYKDPARVRPRIREIAARMAAEAEALAAPVAWTRRVAIVGCDAGTLRLDPHGAAPQGTAPHGATAQVFRCGEFGRRLGGCRAAVVFVVTLGDAIDEAADALQRDEDMVGALFLEMAGWLAIERATKALTERLAAQARAEGCRLSRRMAPGYGDWALEEQAGLFALFEGSALPVRLLESCAMLPRKSRSGLWGLRPLAAPSDEDHPGAGVS